MKPKLRTSGFNKKSLSLSISMILATGTVALSGCSDSDSDGNSLVCLDSNKNAQCDSNEQSKSIATWVDSPVSTNFSNTSTPLAYKGENGRVLTAPAGSKSISPATTLVASEMTYNQLIESKTTEGVDAYLTQVIGGKLDTAQQTAFSDAIQSAIAANPNKNRYAVIAAVTEKVIGLGASGLGGIKDITVTDEEIDKANYPSLEELALNEALSLNIDDKIQEHVNAGWVDAADSSISALSAKNGKIIGGSHYHNSLSVIDIANKTITHSPISTLTDSGHGVDSKSGASENYLRDVAFNPDATAAYVNVAPKNLSSSKNDEATYGLYKVAIENNNTIKTTTNDTVIAIDESVSTRVAVKISSFVVANDGSKVITYSSPDKQMVVYDQDLNSISSIDEMDKVESYAASTDSIYVARESLDDPNNATISKLAVDTLAGAESFSLNFIPQEMLLNEAGTKLLAFNHGHDNNGEMTIALVDLSSLSIQQGTVKITSDTGAISPSFTKLAAVGHESDSVLIIDLTVPGFSVQSAHKLDENANDVVFLNKDQIALTNDRNSIGILDITKTGKNINLAAKSDLALANLNHSTINGGGFLSAVISDVTLSDSYENVSISWSETDLAGSLNATDGTVTRPSNNQADITGTLHAKTLASFRGETVTGQKDFDLTVRKEPALLPEPKSVQTEDNSSNYMASNIDGSIMISPVRFENANEENVYGFIGISVKNGQPTITTGSADTPKTYKDNESIVAVGINGPHVIGVSKSVGDTGQARVFSVGMNGNGVMENTETSTLDIAAGTPVQAGFNADQSLISVMIQHEDESFTTEVYSIDGSGSLSLTNTIVMTAAEYKSYGPPAISDDGSRVYQRDSDNVVMTSSDGQSTASAAVTEIARVWYFKGRVFVNTYEGNIYSFNEDLDESSRTVFSTGTGGRIYGLAGRTMNGKDYVFIPVQRASDSALNGIYQLELNADGSLSEIAFSKQEEGADRMTASGDGDTVFFSYRVRSGDDKGRWLGTVKIPN